MMSWWYNFPPVPACVRGSDVTGGPGLSPAADGSPIERAHVQCVRAGTAHVRATRSSCTVNIPRRVSAVAGFPEMLQTGSLTLRTNTD